MKRNVTILRTLRDGSQTVEYVPRWLADAIVANVPQGEPNTASLRVIEGHAVPSHPACQDWREVALSMAGYAVPNSQVLH